MIRIDRFDDTFLCSGHVEVLFQINNACSFCNDLKDDNRRKEGGNINAAEYSES